MRIPKYIKDTITQAAHTSFGGCEAILFGSRTDDSKKGGDFDIAIKGNIEYEGFKKAKVQFFKTLLLHDLDLPIDLVHYASANKLLQHEIDKKGVRL